MQRRRNAPSIAIVGAGVSGIITTIKLTEAGFHDVTVYERSDGPGGTWWDNTYPGCEVDIRSHAYSFSSFPYDWSRNFARQPEVQRYLDEAIDRWGVRSAFRFGTGVRSAEWDEEAGRYRLLLESGDTAEADILVSCLGLLNNPHMPSWPGLEDFAGPKFHTSRWEHEHDLRGKRIAVVGTGSTGCQIVPELAKVAGHLYHFQRSPTWIVPKGERDFTASERQAFSRFRLLQTVERFKTFRSIEGRKYRKGVRELESAQQQEWREACEAFIAQEIEDPELRKLVTPDYPVGCKRLVFASTYYGALNRENVELVPHAVDRVTETGIVDDTGTERAIDVLVMATGFTPQRFLSSLEVIGRDGRSIHDIWSVSPRALVGMTVPGVPNFLMLYGPNTNGGVSVMSMAEHQAKAVVRVARRMVRTGAKAFDTRAEALHLFVAWLDRQNAKRTATTPELCSNYYFDEAGNNVTQWPSTNLAYQLCLRTVQPLGMTFTPLSANGDGRERADLAAVAPAAVSRLAHTARGEHGDGSADAEEVGQHVGRA